jgi:ABC-type polysaccharide/polyol phosphate transport system ATPase subunit
MQDSDAVISVQNVSKRFAFQKGKGADLREKFASLRRNRTIAPVSSADFWALKDVSFMVRPGQPVGVVGHNGSGKSTLLKILNGIYPPTSGTVRVTGRVGALIEVGAGFHPDLTGRENVYLNGAILGLSRREIAKKFDRIVEFANLEAFIDEPVKRYSSGMYMRLGFSVAAHTDPDILLIDEVLAVGDALFQSKCLRYLKEFVAQGGSVLFVSHAMEQVAELCETCVWLDYGEMRFHGPTKDAIAQYLAVVQEREEEEYRRLYPAEWEAKRQAEEQARREAAEVERRAQEAAEQAEAEANAQRAAWEADPIRCRITGVSLRDAQGNNRERISVGESLELEIAYHLGRRMPEPVIGVDFFREDGLRMYTTSTYDFQLSLRDIPLRGTIPLRFPSLPFNEGRYRVRLTLYPECSSQEWYNRPEHLLDEAASFTVTGGNFANGCVFMPVEWGLPAKDVEALPVAREPVEVVP